MGKILKTDAKQVEKENELKRINSEISSLKSELNELKDDFVMAEMFEDEEEIQLIRDNKDAILQEIADLQKEREELQDD